MKTLAIYWLVGCVLIGFDCASRIKRCPEEHFPMEDVFYSVAAWPTIIFYQIAGGTVRTECPTQQSRG